MFVVVLICVSFLVQACFAHMFIFFGFAVGFAYTWWFRSRLLAHVSVFVLALLAGVELALCVGAADFCYDPGS